MRRVVYEEPVGLGSAALDVFGKLTVGTAERGCGPRNHNLSGSSSLVRPAACSPNASSARSPRASPDSDKSFSQRPRIPTPQATRLRWNLGLLPEALRFWRRLLQATLTWCDLSLCTSCELGFGASMLIPTSNCGQRQHSCPLEQFSRRCHPDSADTRRC